MATFWSGTVPLMLVVGLGAGTLSRSLQAKVPMTMALLMVVVGIFTISFRSSVAIGGLTVEKDISAATKQIENLDHEEMPCCKCAE